MRKKSQPRWSVYWCTTEDHDEDWFVVARSAKDARKFHEWAEGYDTGDALAERVCALPTAEYALAEKEGTHWPAHATLIACGAEFIPFVPQDGGGELRVHTGSGARVVRLNGRVYGEGDIVSNTMAALGWTTTS